MLMVVVMSMTELPQAKFRDSVALIHSRGSASGVSQPVQSVMRAALQKAEAHLGLRFCGTFEVCGLLYIPMIFAPMLA